MDIGADFEDDFFEKPREKKRSCPTNYEPKVCVPLWYMDSQKVGKEDADMLVALKHQADFYYFSHDYGKAADTYKRCLERVQPSNNTWKREFMENLARCFLHLGNAEKALEWSLKLYESSYSPDQKVVSMNLLATVCHKLGKYKEELEALHSCIASHKSCPEFWLRLALCYAGLFKIDLPGCSIQRPILDSDVEPCCAFSSKSPLSCQIAETQDKKSSDCESAISSSSSCQVDSCSNTDCGINTAKCDICSLGIQIVSSCLIHTKMLIDSSGQNHLGIERDARIKDKIAASLKHMEVDQSFIEVASKMLGSDFLAGLQENCDSSFDQHGALSEMINSNMDKKDVS